eukprot:36049-Amphidinium_carterae.1
MPTDGVDDSVKADGALCNTSGHESEYELPVVVVSSDSSSEASASGANVFEEDSLARHVKSGTVHYVRPPPVLPVAA